MIGGDDDAVAAAVADLRRAGARLRGGRHAHPGRDGDPTHGRARLAALRPVGRRALRQDGAQRHRVRADGRLRRGPEHPRRGEHRLCGPQPRTPRRRRSPTRSTTSTTSTWPAITEVWRRGSVVASWLLDLTADALLADPELDRLRRARVSDSGEGRWTLTAAIDEGVPGAGAERRRCSTGSRSRGDAPMADKVLSAMRAQFGGHVEVPDGARIDGGAGVNDLPRRRRAGALRRHRRPGQAQAVPRRCTRWRRTARSTVPVIGVARSDWTDDCVPRPRPRGDPRARPGRRPRR